jgi:hypothetical protein
MKNLWIITIISCLLSVGYIYAELVNGRFDSPVLYDANLMSVSSDLNQGWHAKSASLYDLSESDLWATWLMNQPTYWFGQIYADHYVTAGNVDLDFTVNYMGRNILNPEFRYEIYGTDSTDALTTSLALNTESNHVGSAWTLLSKGSVATPTAGDYHTNLTFSAGYQYIGVRFRFNGSAAGRGTDYAIAADNFSIESIPEPAALAMISLGGFVAMITHRLIRK